VSSRLEAHGIGVDLPAGWDGRIYRRHGGDATLHAANYPLPLADGDFGSVATERMPAGGGFLALTEYRPGRGLEPGRGLFAAPAIPLPLSARQFDPRTLQIGRAGQLGFQHFFTSRGRPFCLYAVVAAGSHGVARAAAGERVVASFNDVLGTVAIG
jgi:hypothetical protein